MGKVRGAVLSLAIAVALAGVAHSGVEIGGADPRAKTPPAGGFDEPAATEPTAALAQGYWRAAQAGTREVREAALLQIETLMHMPASQRWPAALALLRAGALASDGLRAMGRRGSALVPRVTEALADIESGPPTTLDDDRSLASLWLTQDERRRGVRLTLESPREVDFGAWAACGGRLAWMTRDADGVVLDGGVMDAADGGVVLLPAGETVLRAAGVDCSGEAELNLALMMPSEPSPEEGARLRADSRVAFTLEGGEKRRFKVPNEAGVVYRAQTEDLSGNVDTQLSLYAGDGSRRGSNDDGGDELASRLHWIGDGTPLEIEVEALEERGGSFKLVFSTENQVDLAADGREDLSLPEGRWYRFQATVSGRHEILATPVDDIDPVLLGFTPGYGEPVAGDDDGGEDMGSRLELWLTEGESVWLMVGTRSDEGRYRLTTVPPPASVATAPSFDRPGEARSLADVTLTEMPTSGEVSTRVKAGDVILVSGRTAALNVSMSDLGPMLLGEHSMLPEGPGQAHPARISATCWRAEADGVLRVSGAAGLPVGVARPVPGSGLCPLNRPLSAQAPAVAGRSRLDAVPVAIHGSTSVTLPQDANEAWLKVASNLSSEESRSLMLSLRKPGAAAVPDEVDVRLIDGQTGEEVPLGRGCGMEVQTLESGRDYWISLRSGGAPMPAQVVLDLQSPAGHYGLKVGDRVIVHRHYVRDGSSNWASGMDEYLGRAASVTELIEGSPGEALVRLDIDEGQYVWRSESLQPVGI